ncbi:p53 regulated pa26 nuclear protein sestrin, putative, partial [Ichthyophthirius multifiliis]
IEEIKQIIIEHCKDKNQQYQDFIRIKIEIMIQQNPFKECSRLFQELYEQFYSSNQLQEQRISEFYKNENLPSIQILGQYLFNEQEQQSLFTDWPILQNNLQNEEFRTIIGDIYNQNNCRIPHLERLLCWFPDYLKHYNSLTQNLFYGSGPIPVDQRYYIAILATSCYGCDYLHNRLSQQFLNIGGNIEWLETGIKYSPPKIQQLAEINSKLAYTPYELYKNPHIISVKYIQIYIFIKKKSLLQFGWQKNELMLAIFILVFYHGFSCICLALGIKNEFDLEKPEEKGIKYKFLDFNQN